MQPNFPPVPRSLGIPSDAEPRTSLLAPAPPAPRPPLPAPPQSPPPAPSPAAPAPAPQQLKHRLDGLVLDELQVVPRPRLQGGHKGGVPLLEPILEAQVEKRLVALAPAADRGQRLLLKVPGLSIRRLFWRGAGWRRGRAGGQARGSGVLALGPEAGQRQAPSARAAPEEPQPGKPIINNPLQAPCRSQQPLVHRPPPPLHCPRPHPPKPPNPHLSLRSGSSTAVNSSRSASVAAATTARAPPRLAHIASRPSRLFRHATGPSYTLGVMFVWGGGGSGGVREGGQRGVRSVSRRWLAG